MPIIIGSVWLAGVVTTVVQDVHILSLLEAVTNDRAKRNDVLNTLPRSLYA